MTVSCWRGDNRWEEALYVLKKSTTKPGIPTVIDCQLCLSAGNTMIEVAATPAHARQWPLWKLHRGHCRGV